MQNELRKDYFTDNWVVISGEREKEEGCPYCKEQKPIKEVLDEKKNWEIRVVEEPSPLVHPSKFNLSGIGTLLTKTLAHGYSEIVVETKEHKPFHELSTNQIKKVLHVFSERIKELKTREKVECVIVEKNYNEHSNTKIYTFPKVTEKLAEEVRGFNRYKKKKDRCVFCDIIESEVKGRIVHNGKFFVVISPFAPTSSYETWVLSKKHIKGFSEVSEDGLYELSEILSRLTKKMTSLGIDYNFVFHESPSAREFQDFHFHVEVYPTERIKSREVNLNKVTPERAAADLRF